jgi:hypothetical protein
MLRSTFFILLACFAAAQTPRRESPAAKMALPDGSGAWVVRVLTTGGFTGAGEGDWAISSKGDVICTLSGCPKTFVVSEFQSLVEMLNAASLVVAAPAKTTVCRDCITRTLTIQYRDPMGSTHIFAATWDDTTTAKVPGELMRIYEGVRALRP